MIACKRPVQNELNAALLDVGSRTTRKTNPVAWERGLVIAQCSNCEVWHKLSDAAGLVEEIRFSDEDQKP